MSPLSFNRARYTVENLPLPVGGAGGKTLKFLRTSATLSMRAFATTPTTRSDLTQCSLTYCPQHLVLGQVAAAKLDRHQTVLCGDGARLWLGRRRVVLAVCVSSAITVRVVIVAQGRGEDGKPALRPWRRHRAPNVMG